jgi:hypothetical protein
MSDSESTISNAVKIVKDRGGLILPSRDGAKLLDSNVIAEVLLDAVDDTGVVNRFVLAFAEQIVANV